jgi:hypothetical protein
MSEIAALSVNVGNAASAPKFVACAGLWILKEEVDGSESTSC